MTFLSLLIVAHIAALLGWSVLTGGLSWRLLRASRTALEPGAALDRFFAQGLPVAALLIVTGVLLFNTFYRSIDTVPRYVQFAIGLYIASLALGLRLRLLQRPALQRAIEANDRPLVRQITLRTAQVATTLTLLSLAILFAVLYMPGG
ncbi:hypothetical protein [Pseudomonas sp. Marseille-QA0892]